MSDDFISYQDALDQLRIRCRRVYTDNTRRVDGADTSLDYRVQVPVQVTVDDAGTVRTEIQTVVVDNATGEASFEFPLRRDWASPRAEPTFAEIMLQHLKDRVGQSLSEQEPEVIEQFRAEPVVVGEFAGARVQYQTTLGWTAVRMASIVGGEFVEVETPRESDAQTV